MTINIAINGFGRIGRNICRALYESNNDHDIKLVAINDLGDAHSNAHLLKYDSTHGPFNAQISVDESNNTIVINGDPIKVFAERDPNNLPWGDINKTGNSPTQVDVVLECTGHFRSLDKASLHLKAGAKKVLISAPTSADIKNIVYGINHQSLTSSDDIASNASCTTNALATLIQPLQSHIGIVSGIMNTIHSYTNDQVLIDSYHKDLRRARSAAMSMIPTKTGATETLALVMPEMDGRLSGFATRVPTPNVSMIDLTMVTERATDKDEINALLKSASENSLKGLLAYSNEPLVSTDYNHNPASSIYDESLTFVSAGNLVKVCAWYDNEWGFSNRMLDTAHALISAP